MTPLEPFPLPRRDYAKTDQYRVIRTSSYRTICRMLFLLVGLQAITLALLLVEVVR